jgi:hypothetical protein
VVRKSHGAAFLLLPLVVNIVYAGVQHPFPVHHFQISAQMLENWTSQAQRNRLKGRV